MLPSYQRKCTQSIGNKGNFKKKVCLCSKHYARLGPDKIKHVQDRQMILAVPKKEFVFPNAIPVMGLCIEWFLWLEIKPVIYWQAKPEWSIGHV